MPVPPRNPSRRKQIRAAAPLDAAGLEQLALRYVERFATTRARLRIYLARKVRDRGWTGPSADLAALAQKFAGLGYIDDLAFGAVRAAAMGRRGLGGRRVDEALRAAGLVSEDRAALEPAVAARALDAALAFAQRRKIGPFAAVAAERALRQKHIAAMVRGGHDFGLAHRIARMAPGEVLNITD